MSHSKLTSYAGCVVAACLAVAAAHAFTTGPSTPEQISKMMQVTKTAGYGDAYAKIASTIYREAYAMDKQDYTLLRDQFTKDACFETATDFGDLPAPVQKMLDEGVCGHDRIQAYVHIAAGNSTKKPGMWGQHVYTNLWLEKFDGKTALARGYIAGLGRTEHDLALGSDGIWRITRKKINANSFGSAGMPSTAYRPGATAAPEATPAPRKD